MCKETACDPSFLSGLIFCLFSCCMHSCTQPAKKNIPVESNPDATDIIKRKPVSSFSDTLTIHFPAAVFYNPDSLQLQKIKKVTEKNDYETEVHNCIYLMRNASNIMKQYWPKVNMIEAHKARYLLFIKADKTKVCIDLDTKGDMCGIFLFDGKKEPQLADMMNIDTALDFYFSH